MRLLVPVMRALKRWTGLRTWVIESATVLAILTAVLVITGGDYVELIGGFAVWYTFMHAQVAERMSEKESRRAENASGDIVECYRFERRYFMTKELLWFFYFLSLQAWSALVGVGVFLAYRWWRKVWREA